MVTRDFSGYDVMKVLVNDGNFERTRVRGDHVRLEWVHPDGADVEIRHVTVPLHDRVRVGTLRQIGENAGMKDFEAFCAWIDRNR